MSWYLCRVYVRGGKFTDEWFPRVPVEGDYVHVGPGEGKVLTVQLRSRVERPHPDSDDLAAIVHTD